MVGLIHISVSAMLVVHLTLGCCWHHSHKCEGNFSLAHAALLHDGQHKEDNSDHSHHGTNDCQGAKCSVLSPNQTVDDLLIQPHGDFLTTISHDPPSIVGFDACQPAASSGRLLLPVRLHLANQVLLI